MDLANAHALESIPPVVIEEILQHGLVRTD